LIFYSIGTLSSSAGWLLFGLKVSKPRLMPLKLLMADISTDLVSACDDIAHELAAMPIFKPDRHTSRFVNSISAKAVLFANHVDSPDE